MLKRRRISIIYSFISVFVILIVGLAIAGSMNNEKQKFKEDTQISNEEFEKQLFNDKESDEVNDIEESENQIENEENKAEEPIAEEPKKNASSSSSTTNNQSQSNSQNNQNQSQNNSNKNQQTSGNSTVSNNSTTPINKQPWEELGISENDYYNKPIWSYATVTFKVENYSSRSETEAACQKESMRLFNEEEKASSCTSVNSYSGRYLGEWLKVE